ncbi:MAG: pilus assembly protein [Gemmatimonadaceae bacterium]|nr:pilus assembly protein [Gemmatimonadaceae bacterium]
MLLLLVGAIDVARLFATYIGMENAAREGASYGAFHPTQTSDIDARARQEVGGDPGIVVEVTCSPDTSCAVLATAEGNRITVDVTGSFDFIMPLLPNWTLTASSTAVIQ